MSYTTRKTLLEQVLSGNEIAWNEFYEQYYRLIISIGKRWRLSDDRCLDLVQQVMEAIFQKNLTFRYRPELGKFRTFLIGITRNVLLQIRKAESKTPIPCAEIPDAITEEEDNIFSEEWRNYLLDAMLRELRETVDDSTFDAFQMYVLQGIRPEKIAKTLNISTSTVYVYKKRCLDHLKHSWDLLKKMIQSSTIRGMTIWGR